jgi:hypothetical protein
VSGKPIHCKRGVRQGDPLSPLLFVMVADLLQSIVNRGYSLNFLKHLLSKDYGQDYPIIQYDDDTLIILLTEALQIFTLKSLLRSFSNYSGLKVNYNKSFLVPINIDEYRALHLPQTMGYQVGAMPFTYLGFLLGTTRASAEEFLPLLQRIEQRMMGMSKLLTYQGRLTTFFMCGLKVPVSISEQIDKYKKHSLWKRGDINRKGGCLVA